MEVERKGTETLVGLFLLLGFGCLATMVVMFGRVGQSVRHFYNIRVEFPNANGLIKGADVVLAGAKIGQVAESPKLLRDSYRVQATLSIRDDVRIPRKVAFLIGSSGLLGDHFVNVQLEPGFDPADALEPDELVPGRRHGTGLDELTGKGGEVLDRLAEELDHIQRLTVRLNQGLLSDRNLKNIEATFENLKAVSERFKQTSQNLESVVAKAETTVESAQGVIKSADTAAAELRVTIVDARKMLGSATKAVESASVLVKKASDGGGPLGTLINDKKMAEDLKALVTNLRRSGVLFYKDRAAGTPPAVKAAQR